MALPKIQDLYAIYVKMTKREKAILYAVVVFVTLAVMDRAVISPITQKISSLDKEIQAEEAKAKKDMKILSQKDRIVAESAKYSPLLTSTASEDEEVTAMLKEVERLASKSSIYLLDMKPGGSRNMGSQTKKYVINLSCEAQMDKMMEFMFNIENSRKLLTIEKYEISPKSKESSVAQCSMTITKIMMK